MCKRTVVIGFSLGVLIVPGVMAQEVPGVKTNGTSVETKIAPVEVKTSTGVPAPVVKAVTAPIQATAPVVASGTVAEVLPVVTAATKPENTPEEGAAPQSAQEVKAEDVPASESTTESPAIEPSSGPAASAQAGTNTAAQASEATSTDTSKGEELVGIDTVNVDEPAGNWLYKRLYWERAEDKYQKIKDLMTVIYDARTKFFDQRVKMDDEIFDPLYKAASFSRGELSSVLSQMLADIEKQRERKNELDDNERVLFAKVEANKERLEEVRKEIEFVGKIDNAVDEAITTLIGLLNQARNFEMQAWGDFKAISRELSDKKARDLFYRIDTYWRNIKDIEVYITTKLTEHMNYLASSAQQHADIVKGLLKELQEQGFVLKEQVDALEKAKALSAAGADQDEQTAIKAKKKTGGFFASIGSMVSWIIKPFVAIVKALWHTITIPFSYFFGSKKPVQLASVPAAPEVALEGEPVQKQALPKAP